MTHPMISVAGIFLIGAMYGVNSPGAHADVVSCYLKDNTVISKNGERVDGPGGIIDIDLVAETVTICGADGCFAPNPIKITATRKGFKFIDITNPASSAKFGAEVEGEKIRQHGVDSQGRVLVGTGICK